MTAMLASDLNNPEFTGAVNPDSRLVAQFYSVAVKQGFESEAQGRPIYKDVDYVRIFVPGDANTIIETPVRDDHKARFPVQWAHYQNKHGGDAKEIGTPISQWPRISPAQAEELRALKFYTVESIANASDANIQRIGMVGGMQPYAFRDAAMRFLQVATDDAAASKAAQEAAEANARAAALEQRLRELEAKLEAKAQEPAEPAEKRGPGRPRKQEA